MSLMEAESKLHKNAGLLFDGVVSRQRGLQMFTSDVADGAVSSQAELSFKADISIAVIPSSALKISKTVFLPCLDPQGLSKSHGRIPSYSWPQARPAPFLAKARPVLGRCVRPKVCRP